MNLHWLRDREAQQQFNVLWEKGSVNGADYFTKHYPLTTHHQKRKLYIKDTVNSLFFTLKSDLHQILKM